jgi:hypothetical protein
VAEQVSEAPTYPLLKPGEKPTLLEMIFLCNDEAERIENTEAARAKLGEEPLPERVRRAEVFRANAHFLATMVEPNMEEFKAMIARKRGAARRRG